MRTRLVGLLAVAAVLAPVAAGAPPARPLLALRIDGWQADVVRVSPSTLRPAGSPVSLDGFGIGPSVAPDGGTLAVGSVSRGVVRLVDLHRARPPATLEVPGRGVQA